MKIIRLLFSAAVSAPLFLLSPYSLMPAQTKEAASAAGVAIIVNGTPIMNSDIAKRIAFLKLQHTAGDLPKIARQQLTDEMLRRQEITRRGITVPEDEVEKAYAGFAASNHISIDQLNQVMNQSGVTPAHFKAYIRDQMSWGRLVSARYQAESTITPQDAVQRMIKDGGKKPSLDEYLLKQVILVVPAADRGAETAKRMKEADVIRAKISGCNNLNNGFIASQGIKDVFVRTLGRFLEPQIPDQWAQAVRSTPANQPTRAQQTKRGVEFLVVCSVKKVSDDRVAQLVFSMQGNQNSAEKGEALEKKYMQELRSAATIQTP